MPLPRETAEAIGQVKDKTIDNVGLWLDKLIFRRPGAWTLEKGDRTEALGPLCRAWKSHLGEAAASRQKASLAAFHRAGAWEQLDGTVDGRLLMDYGRSTATEASVSFHPIWGVPRIPGSALKGIARAQMMAEGESAQEIEALFGPPPERKQDEPSGRGRIAFYDALPAGGAFKLALDVLTPHHRSYFEGKGPPGEWEDPVPFTFLTVVETRFIFSLGALSRGPEDPRGPPSPEELARARDALTNALEESGVGAKTGAGYGRFSFQKK